MVQYITHHNDKHSYLSGAEAFLKGGGKWVQLRMKHSSAEDIIETGKALRQLCNNYNATLLIDDHVELVCQISADGVHLGKNDMPPAQARNILSKNAIIGGTANTFEDIKNLVAQGVDYIGLGPFRFTSTKEVLSPIIGLEGYKTIIEQCKIHNITTPIFAIGGIEVEDIKPILSTGITGVALSGVILNANNPEQITKTIIKLFT